MQINFPRILEYDRVHSKVIVSDEDLLMIIVNPSSLIPLTLMTMCTISNSSREFDLAAMEAPPSVKKLFRSKARSKPAISGFLKCFAEIIPFSSNSHKADKAAIEATPSE